MVERLHLYDTYRHQVAVQVTEQVVPRTATASASTMTTIALSVEDRITPLPAQMGATMLSGSLGLLDHGLCPPCAGGFSPNAYPALQFPSFFDCFVHIVSQGSQATSVDDIVFHNHYLLPLRHSTPSLPVTSPDAPGLILMAGAYHPPPYPR